MITDHEPLSPATLARGHVESALASLHRMFALDEATALLHIARAIETRQADLDRETWNARVETLEVARGIIAAPAGQPDETLRKAALVVIAQDLDPARIAEAEGILALVERREASGPLEHSRDPQSCGPALRAGGLSPSCPQGAITTTPLAEHGGWE